MSRKFAKKNNKRHEWSPPPTPEVRPTIQPTLFHACEWHQLGEPIVGTLVNVNITSSRATAVPESTRPGESRQAPAYILVRRETIRDGEHVGAYGHVVALGYETYEDAQADANCQNQAFALDQEQLPRLFEAEFAETPEIQSDLHRYARSGLVQISPDKDHATQRLLGQWRKLGGPREPERHLVVADQKETVAELNGACQMLRRALDPQATNRRLQIAERNRRILYVGDCVFVSPDHEQITHGGQRGVILRSSTDERLALGMDNGTVCQIPASEVSATAELGFALTSQQAESRKAQYAYVVLERVREPHRMSYQHSHDPTHTTFYIERNEAGEKLCQLAERGMKHGDTIFQQMHKEFVREQQARRDVIHVEPENVVNRDRTRER